MNKIKKILVSILILMILFVTTNVHAYTGSVVDAGNEIKLPTTLNNESGKVETSTSIANGKMYFQFVEIDKERYDQIRKLKDELNVAEYFTEYENNQTDENYDNYISARAYYKNKYEEELTDFTLDHIDEIRCKIIVNLPDYKEEDWKLSNDNLINIDLSNYEGTKYYTAWVKVISGDRTVYDAQIYDLQGTKNNSNSSDNTTDNVDVIDAGDEIGMPVLSSEGIGKVKISNSITDYKMYYQINEIDKDKYSEIRKLKDELNVAEYFTEYENNETDENYDNYISARTYYKNKYGEELTNFDEEHINDLRAQIKYLLPECTTDWTLATDDKIDANLSSFSGTKYAAIWVKVISGDRTIYDGNVYKLTGTKEEQTIPGDNEGGNTENTGDTGNTGSETTSGDNEGGNTGNTENTGSETTPGDNEGGNTENTGNTGNTGSETTSGDNEGGNTGNTGNTGSETTPGNNEGGNTENTGDTGNTGSETTPGDNEGGNTGNTENTGSETTPGDNEGGNTGNTENTGSETTPGDNEDGNTGNAGNTGSETTSGDSEGKNKENTTKTSKKDDENKEESTSKQDKNQTLSTNSNSNNKSTTNMNNASTSNKELPYTGNSKLILISSIIGAMAIAIITYIRYRKIK